MAPTQNHPNDTLVRMLSTSDESTVSIFAFSIYVLKEFGVRDHFKHTHTYIRMTIASISEVRKSAFSIVPFTHCKIERSDPQNTLVHLIKHIYSPSTPDFMLDSERSMAANFWGICVHLGELVSNFDQHFFRCAAATPNASTCRAVGVCCLHLLQHARVMRINTVRLLTIHHTWVTPFARSGVWLSAFF